jgi:hypothetical protein
MSFPFAVNAALVVNTKPSLADNPETEEIDPKCPCANDDEASNSGSTCPSIPFCPNLPIRDGEEIVVKCFEEAVRLENFVDPNPD